MAVDASLEHGYSFFSPLSRVDTAGLVPFLGRYCRSLLGPRTQPTSHHTQASAKAVWQSDTEKREAQTPQGCIKVFSRLTCS